LDLHLRIRCSRDDVGLIHQPQDAILFRLSFLFLLSPLLAIFLISCGGLVSSGAPPPPPPPVTITVLPASAQPFTGTTVQFSATVQNAGSPAVNWQVNGKNGGDITTVGSISVSGLYMAPDQVPTPLTTVMVAAVLQSDPTKAGSSKVTIQPQSAIQGQLSLSPSLSSVTTSQTLQLNVTSYGLSNNQVKWAVGCVRIGNCSPGTIDQYGLYAPPNLAGPYIITATLNANTSVTGSATVEVTDFAGTFTWRNDNSRSGQNQRELALAPTTFDSSTFGKLFSCLLDGYAYAQPLYVANLVISPSETKNVVFVATEKDSVFAFDADTNANPCVPLWRTSLIPPGEQAIPTPELVGITSKDIVPFIGITGTPVIDVSSSYLYVVAETQTIATNTSLNPTYVERLYALDLATGQPKIHPTGVQISTPNSVSPIFSPLLGNQRAALLLHSGTVYIAFGSHGDVASISAISRATNVVTVTTSTSSSVQVGANVTIAGVTETSFNGTFPVATQPDSTHFTYLQTAADASSSGGTATPDSAQINYHGWLFGYDASTLLQNPNLVFDVTPNSEGGGIWESGGGPSADSNHNIYVATGRGKFEAYLGVPDYGESFLRLNTTGTLSVDYFTPCDQAMLFATGQDIGSSALVLLSDFAGPVPHLMIGAAKNGSLYVLNGDNLGGYNPPCPDSAARVQVVVPTGDSPVPPILSTPLFWNNVVYVGAANSKLKAFPMPGGVLNPTPLASQSPEILGPQGATPVLSSNGANNAIIWLIDTSGALVTPNMPAVLRAFEAGNLSNEIYNSAAAPMDRDKAGLAVKFTVPTVANGKVYVGTQTELDVYGLLH
jgi:hypothetical protein